MRTNCRAKHAKKQRMHYWKQKLSLSVATLFTVLFMVLTLMTLPVPHSCYAVEVGEGTGGTEKANLTVRKFHDYDGDGDWSAEEPEFEDWTVLVNGQAYQTPLALELDPGEYTVADQIPEGWEPTTSAEVTVTLAAGEDMAVFFGNTEEEQEVIIMPVPPALPPFVGITVDPQIPELPRTGAALPWYYVAGGLLSLSGFLYFKRHE